MYILALNVYQITLSRLTNPYDSLHIPILQMENLRG